MKKTMVALATAALLGLGVAQSADAHGPGWGGGRGPGYGYGCDGSRYGMMGPGYGMMGSGYGWNADQIDPAKVEKFEEETKALRRDLSGLRSEYLALMQGDNPDPKRAGELQTKIFDLREQIRAKARETGLPYGGYGRGPGYCWNWR